MPDKDGKRRMRFNYAPIAKNAILIFYFALAQFYGAAQNKLAFQASSPI